jgi:hypothetical protein
VLFVRELGVQISFEVGRSMSDILIGFVFVVMLLAPAIIASMQWSTYVTAESESLSENCSISAIPTDES